MRRLARQREAIGAIGVLLSVFGSCAAAAETKLIASCQEPTAGQQPRVACDLRVNAFAVVEAAKAALKGSTGDLKSSFKAFDSAEQSTNTAYLIQLLPNARRTTLTQMGDAVVTLTDPRQGKRRFAAYTFGDDLSLITDSGTSKAEFVRQIIAVKPASTRTQLYKAALDAVQMLARESGDRKALVILGDGTSDDASYTHGQVVKAARDAGVAIHVLGFYDDRTSASRSKFASLSRLAEETGGYAAEAKQGSGREVARDIVSSRFAREVLENGGTLTADLPGPAGSQTLVLTATPAEGPALQAEDAVVVPARPQPAFETTVHEPEADPEPEASFDPIVLIGILTALGGLGGAYGYWKYVKQKPRAVPAVAHAPEDPVEVDTDEDEDEDEDDVTTAGGPRAVQPVESPRHDAPPRAADSRPAVYGWLEGIDGDAARHPLRTASVHVGRHRDNDICLLNDSISRRHAVLNYDAETRRVVITDLGAGNGVIVNKTRYTSRELNDGDMVELGEIRLRFRAGTETPA